MHDTESTPSEPPENTPSQRVHDALENLKAQHSTLLKSFHSLALLDAAQSMRGSPLPITAEEEESASPQTYSPSASFSTPHARKRTSILTTTTSESTNEWFDADSINDGAEEFILDIPPALESRHPSQIMSNDSRSSLGRSSADTDIVGEPSRVPSESGTVDPKDLVVQVTRRTHLPAAPVGDEGSLFTILKKNVGKVGLVTLIPGCSEH
jgi:hypothetical protein